MQTLTPPFPTHSLHHDIFPVCFSWHLGSLVMKLWIPYLFFNLVQPVLPFHLWSFHFPVGGKKVCRGQKSMQKLLQKVVEQVWRLEQGKERKDVAEEQWEDFMQLWAACDKARVESGPKGQSPLRETFEIPVLTASNHSCKNHTLWIFLYSPFILRPSYQSTAAQRNLTLFGSIVPMSPFFPLENSCLGNPFLTTQSLVSSTVKYP